MFDHLKFSEAVELSVNASAFVELVYTVFGEACAETLCDALHCYMAHEDWHDGSGLDRDFCRIVALAYEQRNGYQPLPAYSCLTDWQGYKKG